VSSKSCIRDKLVSAVNEYKDNKKNTRDAPNIVYTPGDFSVRKFCLHETLKGCLY
jgi:hypothetical protein